MTAQTPDPIEQQPYVVQPEQGTRLEQLLAAYPEAKARADEANSQAKAISDAIKVELTNLAPIGETKIAAQLPAGPRVRLTYSESWRLDSTRLKREHPETWVAYAKKSGSWSLRVDGGGE